MATPLMKQRRWSQTGKNAFKTGQKSTKARSRMLRRSNTQKRIDTIGEDLSPIVALSDIRWLNRLAIQFPQFFKKWHYTEQLIWGRVVFFWFVTACTVTPLTWEFSDRLIVPLFNFACNIILFINALYVFQNEKIDASKYVEIACGVLTMPLWLADCGLSNALILIKMFILRLRYNIMFFQWANSLFTQNRHVVRVLRLLVELVLLIHIYTMYFFKEMEREYENETGYQFGTVESMNEPSAFEKYIVAIHWTISKFWGTDWPPQIQLSRRGSIIFYSMLAYFVEGTLLGALLDMGADNSANKRYERITERTDTINTTGLALGFPQKLIRKLGEYEIQRDLETGGIMMHEILDDLGMDTRREVYRFLISKTFKKVKLFRDAPARFKTMTISKMKIQPFQTDVALTEKNWPMDEFAVIISGTVGVIVNDNKTGKPKCVHTMNPGDSFGELSLAKPLPEAVASVDLISSSPGLLYTISREEMLEILDLFPEQKEAIFGTANKYKKSDAQRRAKENWSKAIEKVFKNSGKNLERAKRIRKARANWDLSFKELKIRIPKPPPPPKPKPKPSAWNDVLKQLQERLHKPKSIDLNHSDPEYSPFTPPAPPTILHRLQTLVPENTGGLVFREDMVGKVDSDVDINSSFGPPAISPHIHRRQTIIPENSDNLFPNLRVDVEDTSDDSDALDEKHNYDDEPRSAGSTNTCGGTPVLSSLRKDLSFVPVSPDLTPSRSHNKQKYRDVVSPGIRALDMIPEHDEIGVTGDARQETAQKVGFGDTNASNLEHTTVLAKEGSIVSALNCEDLNILVNLPPIKKLSSPKWQDDEDSSITPLSSYDNTPRDTPSNTSCKRDSNSGSRYVFTPTDVNLSNTEYNTSQDHHYARLTSLDSIPALDSLPDLDSMPAFDSIPVPLDTTPPPIDSASPPIDSMSPPIDSTSAPLDSMSKPLGSISAPLDSTFAPLDSTLGSRVSVKLDSVPNDASSDFLHSISSKNGFVGNPMDLNTPVPTDSLNLVTQHFCKSEATNINAMESQFMDSESDSDSPTQTSDTHIQNDTERTDTGTGSVGAVELKYERSEPRPESKAADLSQNTETETGDTTPAPVVQFRDSSTNTDVDDLEDVKFVASMEGVPGDLTNLKPSTSFDIPPLRNQENVGSARDANVGVDMLLHHEEKGEEGVSVNHS